MCDVLLLLRCVVCLSSHSFSSHTVRHYLVPVHVLQLRFYSLCGHYTRALKLFIQCGNREIDAAIEVVGKSQSDGLAHQLIGKYCACLVRAFSCLTCRRGRCRG